jgi:hypothetical protein
MIVRTLLSVLALLTSQAAFAESDSSDPIEMAERRLRGCILAGASTAPRTSLAAALASTRAFCGPQIGDLAALRIESETKGLQGDPAEQAKRRVMRMLNDEIALAVANFTGLTEHHAANH